MLQSWPPCRNRMDLSTIFLPIIRSSNLLFEQCHGPNSLGKDCNTIRWQKGSSKSLSTSPFPQLFLVPRWSNNCHHFCSRHQSRATMAQGKCDVEGCGQSRIALDCPRQLCRKHCRNLGGCRSKNHPLQTPSRTTLVAPPFFMPPLPSQPPFSLPSTAPPSLGLTAHPLLSGYVPSIPSSQQQPLSPTLPISPANFSLDAHPNSRGASHRLPIFTEQWQRDQELAEEH